MYQLALYSDQMLPENQEIDLRLMELIGVSKPKISQLGSSPDPNRIYVTPKQAYDSDLGAELTAYTDVENAYDISHLELLFNCDAIHLSGGGTFFFLTWLRQTGLDTKLKQYAATGQCIISVNADAILMTPLSLCLIINLSKSLKFNLHQSESKETCYV